MSDNPTEEYLQKQLGAKLNKDKVKLWLPPYTAEDGSKGTVDEDLMGRYSEELKVPVTDIAKLIENLRLHALEKLALRKAQSVKQTLIVKVAGKVPQGAQRKLNLELYLNSCDVQHLKELVRDHIKLPTDQVKMIWKGKVLGEDRRLGEQGVKHGDQMLALCLDVSPTEARARDAVTASVEETKHAAELLSVREERVQITNQSGASLELPPEERKIWDNTDHTKQTFPPLAFQDLNQPLGLQQSLTLAMTLHEKGKLYLKKKNFSMALPLLLEASKEFTQCRAAILDSVDNYAILCLDIVWTYLCLRNIDCLSDAEARLQSSATFFNKSYGLDLERVIAVKGTSGEEVALLVRLHLMQGIVAFYQQKVDDAWQLLCLAESELQRLEIDDEKLSVVMSMGFKEGEARLGLRACNGDVQRTVSHIVKRREEKEENAKKLKEERRQKMLAKHLGKTANGQSVRVDKYDSLIGMGYPKGASAEALRQANNDVNLALEVLQNHPEFLSLPDPEPSPPITDALISQVVGLGFELEMARRALLKWKGDVTKAVEELIEKGGMLPPMPEFSQSIFSRQPDGAAAVGKTAEEIQEEKEAIAKLVSDLPGDDEDYLDLILDEEKQFLQEYLPIVKTMRERYSDESTS